jgi:hypothetical protein
MAIQRMLAFCVIVASCVTAGCGTVGNLSQTPLYPHTTEYGGVKMDIEGVKESLYAPVAALRSEDQHYPVVLSPIFLTACVVDLPLSLLGDSFTVSRARECRRNQEAMYRALTHPHSREASEDSGTLPFEKAVRELEANPENHSEPPHTEARGDAQPR